MNWYLTVLRNYTNFDGRARRKEYWMFFLFNVLFASCAMLIDRAAGITIKSVGYGPVYLLYALFTLLPGLAVAVRRLHDAKAAGSCSSP